MATPTITPHPSGAWRVNVNGRMFAHVATYCEAVTRARHVTEYARELRTRQDIARIHASLSRMEARH